MKENGQLSMARATWVIARRDFISMVMSKMFLAFLLGPLFSLMIMGFVSLILLNGKAQIEDPRLLVIMESSEAQRIGDAFNVINENTGIMPTMILSGEEKIDTTRIPEMLKNSELNLGAVLHGSLENPELVTYRAEQKRMRAAVNLLIAEARRTNQDEKTAVYPNVQAKIVKRGPSFNAQGSFLSSKLTQVLLYILTSTMAVMVLSNLAEERSNRIVEVLATAIPMEALFAGKLGAMLASVGLAISVWFTFAAGIFIMGGASLQAAGISFEPAVGWTAFSILFMIYFAGSYLFIGAVYLTIGGVAASARDAQTFAMPASIIQIGAFLIGAYASSGDGLTPWIFASIPVISPYVLAGHAAESPGYLIHLYGIGLQIVFVTLAIKYGARSFRRRIVDSNKGSLLSLFTRNPA